MNGKSFRGIMSTHTAVDYREKEFPMTNKDFERIADLAGRHTGIVLGCFLYTFAAADEEDSVELVGRGSIDKPINETEDKKHK